MPEATLREYTDQIRETLRAGRPAEAIEMCRHVLHHYPKHIDSYVLLGQALLDEHDYEQAGTILALVLAADPENVVAYVGMSIVHEAGGMLDEAIWDMERAFEMNPNNVEIREKLMRLRGQRDGIGRYRIKLTTGGLGRMYAQGDLYTRAIQEFETVLRQEPARLDVQLGLVEALWRNRRAGDAVELCQQILARAPNCLKANLLLGKIWQEMGMADEGHRLLQRAQELDPDNEVAQDMFEDQSPLSLYRVKLPLPAPSVRPPEPQEVRPPTPAPGEALPAPIPIEVSVPEWMRAEVLFAEELTAPAPPAEPELPAAAEPSPPPPAEPGEAAPAPPEVAEPDLPKIAVPDWMRSVLAEEQRARPPEPGEAPPAPAEEPTPTPQAPEPPPAEREKGVHVISAFLHEDEFRARLGTILGEAGLEEGELPADVEYRRPDLDLGAQKPPVVAEEQPLGLTWLKEEPVEHGELPTWLGRGVPSEEAEAATPGPEATVEPASAAPAWAPPPWLTGEWKTPAAEVPPPPVAEALTAPETETWTPPAWPAETAPAPIGAPAPPAEEPWSPPPWLTEAPSVPSEEPALVVEAPEEPQPALAEELPLVAEAPEEAQPALAEEPTLVVEAPEEPQPALAEEPGLVAEAPEEPQPALAEEPGLVAEAPEEPQPVLAAEPPPPVEGSGGSDPAAAPDLARVSPEQFVPLEPPSIPTRERLAPDVLQEHVEHLLVEPNDYYARLIVGSAYQEAGKYELALEHYEAIIGSAPSLPGQVVANLEAIARAVPGSMLAHRLLGDAYLKQGRNEDAIAQYSRALELQ